MTTPEQARDAAYAALDATDDKDELTKILDVLMIFAATGQEFSANETRAAIGKIEKTGRIGRAFSLAIEQGWLEVIETVKSNKRNTHGKPVYRYRGRLTEAGAA